MIEIRRAVPEDAGKLTEIAIAAKRHWDYPERWIQIWIPQLTFKPEDILSSHKKPSACCFGRFMGRTKFYGTGHRESFIRARHFHLPLFEYNYS